ncbi:MAG: hypothetical protein ACLUGY_21285 [Phocaeicola massiliensis]
MSTEGHYTKPKLRQGRKCSFESHDGERRSDDIEYSGTQCAESGEYGKAEMYLLRSTRRLPERVYPHYLLVKLYAEPGYFDRVKLVREAEYVLNAEPKVNSTAIKEMRQKVEKLLENKKLWKNK